jgi:hypothetical protein
MSKIGMLTRGIINKRPVIGKPRVIGCDDDYAAPGGGGGADQVVNVANWTEGKVSHEGMDSTRPEGTITPTSFAFGHGSDTVVEINWNSGNGITITLTTGTAVASDAFSSVSINGTSYDVAHANFSHPSNTVWTWANMGASPWSAAGQDDDIIWTL